jgi:transcription factor E
MKKDKIIISLLKDVMRKIAGKNTEEIVDILYKKQNVNEFKIAEKLKRSINEVRNILYKISSFNIIASTRKKDKKKGWYTYFWTLNTFKALEILLRLKELEISNLEHILKSRKMKNFYVCASDGIEMSEETALAHEFLCPECNELMQPVNEDKKVKEIDVRVEIAKKECQIIRTEYDAMKAVIDAASAKLMKKGMKTKKKKKVKKIKVKIKVKSTNKKIKKVGKAKKTIKIKKKVKKPAKIKKKKR